MRWHIELYLEAALFFVLLFRSTGLRWFEILIGVDLVSQILQIIPYRSHYPEFSRLFWQCGVVLIAVCRFMALVEASNPPGKTRQNWAHTRILAFLTAGVTCCAFLMVGQPDPVIFRVNSALLITQAASFLCWIVLFMLS